MNEPIPRSALPSLINRGVKIEGHRNAIYRLVNYSEIQATVYCQHTKQMLHSVPLEKLRWTNKNRPKV